MSSLDNSDSQLGALQQVALPAAVSAAAALETAPPKVARPAWRRISLTQQIFIGLVVGVIVGAVVSHINPAWATVFKPFSLLFVRLVKMLVAPIIFCTLVSGIAGAGHARTVGRIAVRSIIYFEIITTIALLIGLAAVNLVRPGVGLVLPASASSDLAGLPQAASHSWDHILLHTVPTSIIQAMAEGDVLQIVVFSLLFGFALGRLGDKAHTVVALCETVATAMFKLTHIVMHYAPIGVAAALAYTVGQGGLQVMLHLAALVATLYGALLVFLLGVLWPVALVFKIPARQFAQAIKEPALIAFTTTSSEAALPRTMEVLEQFGVPRRIVALVLPLGYSFNLDGTTLYLSLAAVFVAQAAGVTLTVGQQVTMLLTLMLTSKGVAGVPRVSLIVLAGTLASFGLPLEGLALLLGVDAIMDMARTAVNVIGNALATVVVAKMEGQLSLQGEAAGPTSSHQRDSGL